MSTHCCDCVKLKDESISLNNFAYPDEVGTPKRLKYIFMNKFRKFNGGALLVRDTIR